MIKNNTSLRRNRVDVPDFTIQHKLDNKIPKHFHSHKGYEIVWVRAGRAQFIFEEKVFHLKKGQVLCFESSAFHTVRLPNEEAYERILLMFTNELFYYHQPIFEEFKQLLGQKKTPHCLLQLDKEQLALFQRVTHQLLHEYNTQEEWQHHHAVILYLSELLLFFTRELHPSRNQSLLFLQSNKMKTQEKILKVINQIWDSDWQLDDMASKLHFSKYYLCHFFKSEFGMTIHQYINEKRMYEAKKLLLNSNKTVTEIAEQIGFSTASNFIRCFKKHQQVTPKQFRTQALHGREVSQ